MSARSRNSPSSAASSPTSTSVTTRAFATATSGSKTAPLVGMPVDAALATRDSRNGDRADDEERTGEADDRVLQQAPAAPGRIVCDREPKTDGAVRQRRGEHRRVPGDPDAR